MDDSWTPPSTREIAIAIGNGVSDVLGLVRHFQQRLRTADDVATFKRALMRISRMWKKPGDGKCVVRLRRLSM
jgi:precorrin-6B methylase 1